MIRLRQDDFAALAGVHPLLSAIIIAGADEPGAPLFRVTSGLRTAEEQERLWAQGVTPLRSGSLHQRGRAVDIAILSPDRGRAIWSLDEYFALNGIFQAIVRQWAVPGAAVIWGGGWKSVDATHWELSLAPIE